MTERTEQIEHHFHFMPKVDGLPIMNEMMMARIEPHTSAYGWRVVSIRVTGVTTTVTGRKEGFYLDLPPEGFVTGHLFEAVVEFLEQEFAQTIRTKVQASRLAAIAAGPA